MKFNFIAFLCNYSNLLFLSYTNNDGKNALHEVKLNKDQNILNQKLKPYY